MEQFYQYIWQHSLWQHFADSRLVDGTPLKVLSPGLPNGDAGPDFFNARISAGGNLWAGNVEIHVNASDWMRHRHDGDPAYDSVILHVVGVDDMRIRRADGSEIPQLLISAPPSIMEAYGQLTAPGESKPCDSLFPSLSPLHRHEWLSRLGIERLQSKAKNALRILESLSGDWEQTCFTLLARSLGFGLNSEAFEVLALNTPLSVLAHHSDNILQLEAILFGQAGMLDPSVRIFDEYYQLLCREYFFLARKYSLRPPLKASQWKYARTRPANFPHRRIALLASLMEGGTHSLMSRIMDADGEIDALELIFRHSVSSYWNTHFSFDSASAWKPGLLSRGSLDSICVNAVAPLLYAYALHTSDATLADKAVAILYSIPAEKNSVTGGWKMRGVGSSSAFDSQALIHLYKNYCSLSRCFECRWGQRVFRNKIGGV